MTTHTRDFDLSKFNNSAAVRGLHTAEVVASPYTGVKSRVPSWFGIESVKNLEGVISTVIARGDYQTTERVAKAAKEAASLNVPAARTIKPALVNRRATGQRYDLERVLSGDSLPWSRWERSSQRTRSRIVSLYVPIGGLAERKAGEIGWAPVAAIVAADLFEQAGYRVEVWGVSKADCEDGFYALRCNLKNADQPVDLNAISRVAHPAIFRGLFMPLRMATWGLKKIGDGYGSTCAVDPNDFGDENGIALNHTYSVAECLAEITRVVKTFGEN